LTEDRDRTHPRSRSRSKQTKSSTIIKKNPASKSGIFNPRVFLAFFLCSVGVLLGILGFAPLGGTIVAAQGPATFKPVISYSVLNGISPAVRDLPLGLPIEQRTIERDLRRVKPTHPVIPGLVDPAVQTAPGALAMPTPTANFEGQSTNDSGCGCIPPDTNGAVGPTQYVQMVNSVFSVYSKTGTRLTGPKQINSLFSGLTGTACANNNDGDPVVVYDRIADRWLLSQLAVPGGSAGYHECIAISQGPDATGPYYVYDFLLSLSDFEDYPHFGLWPDAYYMSTHQFNPAGTAYLGAGVFAFERAKMLLGQPAQMVYFNLGSVNLAFGGHLPAHLDGPNLPPPGSPNYFAEVDNSTDIPPNAALRIWKFHVDWSNPSNSTFGNSGQPSSITAIADFARPNCNNYASGCVPQKGDSVQLDPIGDRLMYRLAYRNFADHESLVLNHTVVANSTTGQMGPRWYEVRDPDGTPQIFQQSTLGPTGMTDLLYRWMSSIAMDNSGDIAIGYSTSSSTNFPSIAYAGRLAGDPLNTLGQGETQLFAGAGPQHVTIGRWGDYTDLTIDPSEDCTFWYTNEYYAATGLWHTRIGSFKFPQCVPPVQLRNVVSRMTHGSITMPPFFDINFPLPPTTSPRGVECRSSASLGAGNYMLVFTFSNNLTSVASASVTSHDPTSGTGTVSGSPVVGPNASLGLTANQCAVNLTGMSTGQYITVTLNSVLDAAGNSGNILSPQMGFLVGDVNFGGVLSNADVSLVKAQVAAGASVDSSNFQDDINANAVLSNADVSLTKAQVAAGAQLPSTP
jgi:hypothetical protein